MNKAILLTAFAIIVAAIVLSQLKCNRQNTTDYEKVVDSMNAVIKKQDSTIDIMTGEKVEAGWLVVEANKKVDTLENKLTEAQRYAASLAKQHWIARDNKDTAGYIINCDEMAGQLSDSRDSVNSLMYEINQYKYGVNDFQTKYQNEHKITDSLLAELLVSRAALKTLAVKAINSLSDLNTDFERVNKPKIFIGAKVLFPMAAFGPQVLFQNGRYIFSGAILSSKYGTQYEGGAHVLLQFKKTSILNLLK